MAFAMVIGINQTAKNASNKMNTKKNAHHSYSPEEVKPKPCTLKAKTPSDDILCLETAKTPREREIGLMFRKSLDKDKGMMFFFEDGGQKGFWMKNTLIPLDIIFMDENFAVIKVFADVQPSYIGAPDNEIPMLVSYGRNVLEISGGMAEKYGLMFGTKLDIIN